MALLKCPECSKDVSDKAHICPHCGYPINELMNNDCYNNVNYNYDVILIYCSSNKITIIKTIQKMKELSLLHAKSIVDNIDNKPYKLFENIEATKAKQIATTLENLGCKVKIIPSNPDNENYVVSQKEKTTMTFLDNNTIRCPRCGSTSVTTGQRGYNLLTGFLGSNKTVNRCGKCGYSWKP